MRYFSLDKLFYMFVALFWTIYASAFSCILYMLLTWQPTNGGHRLLVADTALAVISALSIFVWWAEWGNPRRSRTWGLPQLNTDHWVFIAAMLVWLVYFTPLAITLYLLLTWTHETGGFRFGMSLLSLGLMCLMGSRIGRQ